MKKVWFCLITLFAVALMSTSIGLAQEYALSDLYQQALKNSEKIKYTEENLYIAQMGKNKAWAVLIPKVTAFGTYNRFTEDKYVVSTTSLLAPLPTISNNVLIQPEQSGDMGCPCG
ncbi:MAG: TolC family protein [Desulfobacterales bacterium]|nr:TolC family protein [Desulfobacterales bacterium]